jgi:hypothetical protein
MVGPSTTDLPKCTARAEGCIPDLDTTLRRVGLDPDKIPDLDTTLRRVGLDPDTLPDLDTTLRRVGLDGLGPAAGGRASISNTEREHA